MEYIRVNVPQIPSQISFVFNQATSDSILLRNDSSDICEIKSSITAIVTSNYSDFVNSLYANGNAFSTLKSDIFIPLPGTYNLLSIPG